MGRIIIFFSFLLIGLNNIMLINASNDKNEGLKTDINLITDTTIIILGTKCDILLPSKPVKGTILVLPGWNFHCNDICLKSDFCKMAINDSFSLVMPDMQKSVYATEIFPETRKDWKQYHSLYWITDTLIPYIQKNYKLLKSKQNNFLFGISTGARGVSMLAIYTENIFIAGAGLSGDYNQLTLTNDKLMQGYYGLYEKFPKRWSGKDNPLKNAEKIKIPLYLAHGDSDNIVPFLQTTEFYHQISKLNPSLGHELSIKKNFSHNYKYWETEYAPVFKFFKKHMRY